MHDKFKMFENRLSKVLKHNAKTAHKQHISCYRVYEIDLPEFPFIIDVYKDCIYVSEYKSKHKLSDTEYLLWFDTSLEIIAKVFKVDKSHIFVKLRERQKGEQQYTKINQVKKEMIVDEIWYIINAVPSPWGFDNNILFKIYADASADDYECPTVVVNKEHNSCGQSRFGCWTCTVVTKDKAMEGLIQSGEDWMLPLLKFRDVLANTTLPEQKETYRNYKRRM